MLKSILNSIILQFINIRFLISMEGPVFIVAIVKIKPECIEEAKRYIEELADASRKEPGCLRYDVFNDIKEEGKHVFLEEYKSIKDF